MIAASSGGRVRADQPQEGVVDDVQRRRLRRDRRRLLGVVEVAVLVVDHLPHAHRRAEVGDAEDQARHPRRRRRDLVRVDDRQRRLDQRLDLHVRRPAALLLQRVQQPRQVHDVVVRLRLRQDDAVELVRRAEHDRLHVAQEVLRADVVRPDRDHLVAEVDRVQRLDERLAARVALELVRARILEVRHHVVDRRLRRLLVHLQRVARIRQLRPRDDEPLLLLHDVHLAGLLVVSTVVGFLRVLDGAEASFSAGHTNHPPAQSARAITFNSSVAFTPSKIGSTCASTT